MAPGGLPFPVRMRPQPEGKEGSKEPEEEEQQGQEEKEEEILAPDPMADESVSFLFCQRMRVSSFCTET